MPYVKVLGWQVYNIVHRLYEMGMVHCINGGQSGTFNVSWEKWQESLGLGPSASLEFCINSCLLSALVWVKENDFEDFSIHVRRGWFCTSVACCSSYYHILLLIVIPFCYRVGKG